MAYLLSKLLPLALLPVGLSLILLLVGLIGRWRWPVITAVILLWLCSLGLVNQTLWRWLEAPWSRQPAAAAPSADAIVVRRLMLFRRSWTFSFWGSGANG